MSGAVARLASLLLSLGLFGAAGGALRPARADTSPAGAYRVLNLGTLGGAASRAYGVNDSGQVVGEAQNADGHWRAFLWQDGRMTDLGTLGGPESAAYAINNLGQVVGKAATSQLAADGSPIFHAFVWENGVMRDLGTFGGLRSTAYGLNNLGHVVGQAQNAGGEARAFRWTGGALQDLGTLGGNESIAYDINDRGQVVGESFTGITSTTSQRKIWSAFRWQDGQVTSLDAERFGGFYYGSAAFHIDENEQAVGFRNTEWAFGSATTAAVWRAGQSADSLPSSGHTMNYSEVARAGNGLGLVVGSRRIGYPGVPLVARYWSGTEAARPLNDLLAATGWVLNEARAVNARGEVAGIADAAVSPKAFLLSPVSVRPAGAADLTCTITAAEPTVPIDQGRAYRATLQVRNASTTATPACTARWFASVDSALYTHDNFTDPVSSPNDPLLAETPIPALAPAETYQVTVTVSVPKHYYLSRDYLLAEIDAVHQVSESSETNNLASTGPLPIVVPPPAPTELRVKTLLSREVGLKWTTNLGEKSAGYEVERKTGDGSFAPVGRLETVQDTFTDSTVQPGGTYTYRVRAFNAVGTSAYSNELTLTVPLPGLASLTVAPRTVRGGQTAVGVVTLDAAAPEGGTAITLTVSGAGRSAQAPAAVTVPAGALSAEFTLTTKRVRKPVRVSVTAQFNEGSHAATLLVKPPRKSR